MEEQVLPAWVFHQDHTGGHWEAPYAGHWKLKVVYEENAGCWRVEAAPAEHPDNNREEWIPGSPFDPEPAMACARRLADAWNGQYQIPWSGEISARRSPSARRRV